MKRIPGIFIIIATILSVAANANSQEGEIKSSVSLSEAVIDDRIKEKEDDDKLNLSFEEKHKDKDYIILLHETEVILKKDYSYKTRVH
jgi:hypothetical protein